MMFCSSIEITHKGRVATLPLPPLPLPGIISIDVITCQPLFVIIITISISRSTLPPSISLFMHSFIDSSITICYNYLFLLPIFSTFVLLTSCVFFPVGPSQETEETTIPVENVALTTKGLRKQNTTCEWDCGGKK